MEQIMKVYLAIFLMLLMLFSAGGVFKLFLDVANAQDFTSNLIHEVECSDFDYALLTGAFERAEEADYALEMELYRTNGGSVVASSEAGVPSDTRDVYLARIVVTYPMKLGLFEVDRRETIQGYAR